VTGLEFARASKTRRAPVKETHRVYTGEEQLTGVFLREGRVRLAAGRAMKPASARSVFLAMALLVAPWLAHAQIILPQLPPLPWHFPEKKTEPPLEPKVALPRDGEVVAGDLQIAASVSPKARARNFAVEAAYWDAARKEWIPVGLLCPQFPGDTATSTRVPAEARTRLNSMATRWRIHLRVIDPPGHWGPWREFSWVAAESPKWPIPKLVKDLDTMARSRVLGTMSWRVRDSEAEWSSGSPSGCSTAAVAEHRSF